MSEAAGAAAAGAAAGTPWYQGVAGVDDAMIGHLKNQGWDTKPANEVAVLATKSWKEAEKFIGAPAAEILRLPKEANDPAWRGVYERLGAPKEAKDYDFSTVKRTDGTTLDEGLTAALRDVSHRRGLSKDAATDLAAAVVKYDDGKVTAAKAEATAKLAEEKAALKKSWGANEAANMFIAQRAAQALGMKPEVVSALESVAGYAAVFEMFRQIGTKIGEDKFVQGQQGNQGGVMTREEAVAKKADLMRDKAWAKRYLDGGLAEKREMTSLNVIISGEAP